MNEIEIDGIKYVKVKTEYDTCNNCALHKKDNFLCLSYENIKCDNYEMFVMEDDAWKYQYVGSENPLKSMYESICCKYAKEFAKMYFCYDDETPDIHWIGDDIGGLMEIADYVFNIDTIRWCVDCSVPRKMLFEWYDYTLKAHDFCLPSPNIKAWYKGCPRVNDEQFKKLASIRNSLKEEIEKTKQECEQ